MTNDKKYGSDKPGDVVKVQNTIHPAKKKREYTVIFHSRFTVIVLYTL